MVQLSGEAETGGAAQGAEGPVGQLIEGGGAQGSRLLYVYASIAWKQKR